MSLRVLVQVFDGTVGYYCVVFWVGFGAYGVWLIVFGFVFGYGSVFDYLKGSEIKCGSRNNC